MWLLGKSAPSRDGGVIDEEDAIVVGEALGNVRQELVWRRRKRALAVEEEWF